jgi:hypothetical protein
MDFKEADYEWTRFKCLRKWFIGVIYGHVDEKSLSKN